MIRAVFARELRGSLGALAVVSASLACCAVAIASMFSPETARMLEDLKAAMPELYDAFGMGNDTSTLTGFLLNYLYGFLLTLGPLALTLLAVSRPSAALWAGGGLCLAEYLVQMVAQISGTKSWGRFLTFFSLFDPYALAASDAGAIGAAVCLALLGAALTAGAVAAFSRRDLCL